MPHDSLTNTMWFANTKHHLQTNEFSFAKKKRIYQINTYHYSNKSCFIDKFSISTHIFFTTTTLIFTSTKLVFTTTKLFLLTNIPPWLAHTHSHMLTHTCSTAAGGATESIEWRSPSPSGGPPWDLISEKLCIELMERERLSFDPV